MIKVYSKKNCVQCAATVRWLDNHNVEYDIFKTDESDAAYQTVESLGYKSLPVVVGGDNHWSGFRPDLLATLL